MPGLMVPVPMVEAMVHLVLCDHFLRQRAQNS